MVLNKRIRKIFQDSSEAAGYLAGVIDGEGYIPLAEFRIRIGNTDLEIINACQSACKLLGIKSRVVEIKKRNSSWGKKPFFEVVISRKDNLVKAFEVLPLQSRKKDLLKQLIENYRKRSKSERAELAVRANDLYKKGLSSVEVGKELGLSPNGITKLLRAHGYPIRSAAESNKLVRERVFGKTPSGETFKGQSKAAKPKASKAKATPAKKSASKKGSGKGVAAFAKRTKKDDKKEPTKRKVRRPVQKKTKASK